MNVAGRAPVGLSMSTRLIVAFASAAALPALALTGWLAVHGEEPGSGLIGAAVAVTGVAALSALVVARVATYYHDRSLRHVLRAARRLAAGDFSHLIQVDSSWELRELSAVLERIGVRLESLQSALDHLEVVSGFELGKRSTEIETWKGESERLRFEASVLHQYAAAINRTVDPAQICSQLVAHAENSVDYDWAAACLVDSATRKLVPVFVDDRTRRVRQVGHHLRELGDLAPLAARPWAAWAVQTGAVVRLGDGRDERWKDDLPDGLHSLLVVPLVARDEALGVVELAHTRPRAYHEEEQQFLTTLAGQAATAIENARLLEEAAKVEAFRELDRLKSELLSTVSHELRTPLVSIKGYAETLLRQDVEWTEEQRREFLQSIHEESEHLRTLIEDLLQMSQIEAGRLRLSRQPLRLNRLAQRVVRKARQQARQHSIAANFSGDLPLVDADPKRVEQVLTNLIQNAIKYSPDGGAIRVRGLAATARPSGEHDFPGSSPSHVVVAVADEGVGIPGEQGQLIFDRFYRIDGELARETGGSGLGLAICRGIVEAHGGRIWVESPGVIVRAGDGGRGSTFYFSLPVRGSGADEREAEAETDDELRLEDGE